MASTASSALISVEELRERLDEVTLLDVRWKLGGPPGADEFAAGHLPGAVFVDLESDLADPPGPGGRHPLPSPGRFEEAMVRAGVSASRPVVVYDDASGQAAARCWWLLRYHGHPDVRLLDGGLAAWRAAGGPETIEVPRPPLGDFSGGPGEMPTASAAEVPEVDVLVDVRVPERYRGEREPIDPIAGRILGAVNVPVAQTLDNHGHLRDPHELRAVFERVGVTEDKSVAVYCGSGVNACHTVLAMELAGIRAALYPGSFSGWITDPDRPVEKD
jgi:thiosulfate/3-mercaptopyruvate sulfurtransferase